MLFGFGDFSDMIDEDESLFKVSEREFTRDGFCVFGEIPVIDFGGEFEGVGFLHGENTAFARDAVLLVEGCHRVLFSIAFLALFLDVLLLFDLCPIGFSRPNRANILSRCWSGTAKRCGVGFGIFRRETICVK